jgi:hypothetical protein
MRHFILFITLFFCCSFLKAQQTCSTAVVITPAGTCNYSTHTTTGTDYWLRFVAASPTVNISLVTVKFGINATHIHNLALYSGNCSSPVLVADDELPFVADAKELAIDLNASGLIIGQTYYLKASRLATHTDCDKAGCTANGSTDPTVFDVCVQDIDVFIPLDFGLEAPSISHSYTTNRGQLLDIGGNQRPDVKLYTIHTNPAVYIADDKISYVFSKMDTSYTVDSLHRVDMSLVGANTGLKVFKTEQIEGLTNFYYPHIAAGVTGNKSYSRAVCNEVYPLIDMQYYSNQNGVKYYFVVKPGGDAEDIILKFDGATAIVVTPSGGLDIKTSLGTLDFEPPHAYRINPAGNPVPMPWQCKFEYIPASNNTVKFKVHNYDPIMPLIIQIDRGHNQLQQQQAIGNLDWSTYFNGQDADFSFDVTNDDVGNTYMVGKTQGNNFPTLNGQFTHQGNFDGFITQFDILAELKWATYYGGSGRDVIYEASFNLSNQNLYAIGKTYSTDIPIAPITNPGNGSFYQSTGYGVPPIPTAEKHDAFIIKMNNNTGQLNWSTYFGGAGDDMGRAIKCDRLGNVHVTGVTNSTTGGYNNCEALTVSNFPLCNPGAGAYHQANNAGSYDVFYAKFDANNFLLNSTFFGSNQQDNVFDIGFENPIPANNGVYLVGSTFKTFNTAVTPCSVPTNGNFPLCNGGSSPFYAEGFSNDGSEVAFISKFNLAGELKWSTLFPYVTPFQAVEVIPDPSGTGDKLAFAVGYTGTLNPGNTSINQPTSGQMPIVTPLGAYQQINNAGQNDLFITQFNKANQLSWSTFFGEQTDEYSNFPSYIFGIDKKFIDIAATNSKDLYVMGVTQSSSAWTFVTNPNPSFYNQSTLAGDDGATCLFLAGFGGNLGNFWSSLFGGAVPNPDCPSGFGCIDYNSEIGTGLSVFNNDNVYISGYTLNQSFPQECPTAPNPWCQFPLLTSELLVSSGTISRLDINGIVGIEDVMEDEENGVLIYPNPSTNQFTITSTSDIERIEIYNAVGQLIYHEQPNNHVKVKTLTITNYTTGIYLIKVTTKDNLTQLKKLIVE